MQSDLRLALAIGSRYVISGGGSSMVAFISRISMAGLIMGVAVLTLVLSVMNGFERELQQRILGVLPQVTLYFAEPVDDWEPLAQLAQEHPGVEAAAPFAQFQGLLVNGSRVETVAGFGVVANAEKDVSALHSYMIEGDLAELDEEGDAVFLSVKMAQQLGVNRGDPVLLVIPDFNANGSMLPRLLRLRIGGKFSTNTEIDNMLVLTSLESIASLRNNGFAAEGIRVRVSELFEAPEISHQLSRQMPVPVYGTDWTRTHGNLVHAIELSRRLVMILVFLIMAVAVFNVVSTLVLAVREKQGDIAILATLGATPAKIMLVFIVQGTLIGLVGTAIGAFVGAILSLTITDLVVLVETLFAMDFLKSDVYPVSYLPSHLKISDLAGIIAIAMLMSIIATLYPAWRATKLQPADVLRHD